MFQPFARSEQRVNGGLYLRGLMLDGRRKSMVLMAERLGVDHQRLPQFVTLTTWNHAAVRRRLAELDVHLVCDDHGTHNTPNGDTVRQFGPTQPACEESLRPDELVPLGH